MSRRFLAGLAVGLLLIAVAGCTVRIGPSIPLPHFPSFPDIFPHRRPQPRPDHRHPHFPHPFREAESK
jgi:hypothetical protein